jgi:hypothetical protein
MMSKPDLGMGLGAALLVAVCCGGKLLLVALLASGAAVLTGQAIVIMAAAVLALVAIGLVIWRRQTSGCTVESGLPTAPQPTDRVDASRPGSSAAPTTHEPVGAGKGDGR